jgi:signal transduction histidine kinase
VTARESVDELKRLLAVLREERAAPELAPQPDLSALERLVDGNTASGLAVELTIEGERRPLSPGIELAAYRVVQETLTNVRKHAGAGLARACLTYGPRALEIVIDNDGADARPPNGCGHGIVGMRERVLLYGGSLDAGPREGGGFRVRALLPLDGVPRRRAS